MSQNQYSFQWQHSAPYQTDQGLSRHSEERDNSTVTGGITGRIPIFPSQLLPPQPHQSQNFASPNFASQLPAQQYYFQGLTEQSFIGEQFQLHQGPAPFWQDLMAPPPPQGQQEGNTIAHSQWDGTFELADFLVNTEPDLHQSTGTSILEAGSIHDQNGRTYQGYREGKYFLPNDPAEQDRLDFQHAGITILLEGKLSWVPFATPPRNVLDVATGTGLWAMEFARMYPDSSVVGSDISCIQPETDKPANCNFVQEDAEEPWLHPQNHFDYIHLRLVHSCFDHPKTVIQHAFTSLAPGGWIEFHDTCPRLLGADGTTVQQNWEMLIEGAANMGRDIVVAPYFKQWLVEAGFTDVHEVKLPWPMNGWPENPRFKQAGRFMQKMLVDNARGISYKMLQAKGLAPAEIEMQIKQCKDEFQDETIHGFWPFYVVYGRKPLVQQTTESD